MRASSQPDFSAELKRYLEVSTDKYQANVGVLEPGSKLVNPTASVRFHYLRLDGNGQPKFNDLAAALADHLIHYCFSARRRNGATKIDEISRLDREARQHFRKFAQSGEAGEILLYFLIEAVLGAPQLIAKMELKTSPRMENHGSDGVHFKWHETDRTLDLYFGEAKLEQDLSSAMGRLLKSLENFHRDGLLDHEIGLVTSHYKHANEAMRQQVLRTIDRQSPAHNCRINHACLIAYDWDAYSNLNQQSMVALEQEVRQHYEADRARLLKLLGQRLGTFSRKQLRFEVFFLPFRTVQEFRDAFNALLK